ncbi:S-layer homology domain-containing protein [Candidatus Peregrinibacteria bacterium]|nr:S-layer homology domain-containing protein [Candidatus Peregrinibacteria bacterium]
MKKFSFSLKFFAFISVSIFISFISLTSFASTSESEKALVTLSGDGTLGIIDLSTNRVVSTLSLGGVPTGVVVTPDVKIALAVNNDSEEIVVIDLSDNSVLGSFKIGKTNLSNLEEIALTPDGKKALVTFSGDGTLQVLDINIDFQNPAVYEKNLTVLGTISLGGTPTGIVVSPDGKIAFSLNTYSEEIVVIDLSNNSVIGSFRIGKNDFSNLEDIVLTSDGKKAFVSFPGDGIVEVLDINMDFKNQAVYEKDLTVLSTIITGGVPTGISITADGKNLLVADNEKELVLVIDLSNNSITKKIAVGKNAFSNPEDIAVIPNLDNNTPPTPPPSDNAPPTTPPTLPPEMMPPTSNGQYDVIPDADKLPALTKQRVIEILKEHFTKRYGENLIYNQPSSEKKNQGPETCFKNTGALKPYQDGSGWWIYSYFCIAETSDPISRQDAALYLTSLLQLPVIADPQAKPFKGTILEYNQFTPHYRSVLYFSPYLYTEQVEKKIVYNTESNISESQFLKWIDSLEEGEKSGFHRGAQDCAQEKFYKFLEQDKFLFFNDSGRMKCVASMEDVCQVDLSKNDTFRDLNPCNTALDDRLQEETLADGFECKKYEIWWFSSTGCTQIKDDPCNSLFPTKKRGYYPSLDECTEANNGRTTPIPRAGYEDPVLVNSDGALNPFPDTDISSLPGKAAAELFRRGVIGGRRNGNFEGDALVNRAEFVKFALLARFGKVDEIENNGKFPDLKTGEWYMKFVLGAAKLGIIQGYPDGKFRPELGINTAEFLKMITITFDIEKNLPYSYSDVTEGDWFSEYAGAAERYEIFPERTEKLEPGRYLTRYEVATGIYQFLKNREE